MFNQASCACKRQLQDVQSKVGQQIVGCVKSLALTSDECRLGEVVDFERAMLEAVRVRMFISLLPHSPAILTYSVLCQSTEMSGSCSIFTLQLLI